MTDRRRFALKFGSEISLYHEDDGGASSSASGCFLSCPGGAHPRLCLRPGLTLSSLLSFENCVFVVHPPFDVLNRTAAVAGPAAAASHGSDPHTPSPSSSSSSLNGGAAVGRGNVSRNAAEDLSSKLVLMTEVTYGAKFCLKHKQSGLFISMLTTQPSEMDPDCHMIALISEAEAASTRSASFRFTPRFKVHNEGDYVCQGDQLLIQTNNLRLYVHISEIAAAFMFGGTDGNTTMRRVPPSPLRKVSSATQVLDAAGGNNLEVNGSESATSWVIQRYDSGLESADLQKVLNKGKPPVLFGTPVALFHREREALLTSSIAKPQQQPQDGVGVGSPSASGSSSSPRGTRASLGSLSSKSSRDLLAIDARRRTQQSQQYITQGSTSSGMSRESTMSVAEAENASLLQRSGHVYPLLTPAMNYLSSDFSFATLKCSCTAYWVFEHADPTTGGPLRFGEPFRLRQAATNMYLCVTGGGGGDSNNATTNNAFFGNNVFFGQTSSSELPLFGRTAKHTEKGGGGGGGGGGPTIALVLTPTPTTDDELRRSLFSMQHMFFSDARIVAETDFFRVQNVETGCWLCTDSDMTSSRTGEVTLQLDLRPTMHDAWMAGHVSEVAHKDVLHIFYCYDALLKYKNIFAQWTRDRGEEGSSKAAKPPPSAATMEPLPPSIKEKSSPPSPSSSKASGASSKDGGSAPPPLSPSSTFKTKSHLAVIRRCTDALTSLIYFCSDSDDKDPFTREGLPNGEHQRMMFDLQLHRIVFDIIVAPLVPVLDAPSDTTTIDLSTQHRLPDLPLSGGAVPKKSFDVKHAEYGALHNISRLGFRLIKQMVLGNPTSAALLSKYIPLMFELDGMKLHVVEVMHEIFTENSQIPLDVLTTAVDHYVRTLVNRTRSAGYLKFLATMCAERHDNAGIVENQELVCRKLIVEVPPEQSVLLSTVLLESGHVGVQWASSEPPTSIERFLTQHPDSKLVKYFEGQIELFAKLSCGFSSPLCLKTLETLFPSLQLNGVINTVLWTGEEVAGHPSKLDLTRCNILKLAMNVYVHPELRNPESQIALKTVLIGSSQLREKWRACKTDPHAFHSGVRDSTIMASIKTATLALLQANPFISTPDRSRNELLKTVIDVWASFVYYSQYSTDELRTLLPLLVQLLDGKRDAAVMASNPTFINRAASNATFTSSSAMSFTTTGGVGAIPALGDPVVDAHLHPNNTSSLGARERFAKTEDTVVVMEVRHSICKLLRILLSNLIHETSDDLIVFLFESLGGVRGNASPGTAGAHSLHQQDDQSLSNERVPSPSMLQRLKTGIKSFTKRNHVATETHDGKVDSVSGGKGSIKGLKSATPTPFALPVLESKLASYCRSVEDTFQPKVLVPILLDVAQYNHDALTTDAMHLLTELCCVQRRISEQVLLVKITPSREMYSQFDRLHLVAVELISASDHNGPASEEFVDAMEMVLKTLLQSYVPKNKLRSATSAAYLGSMKLSHTSAPSSSGPPSGVVDNVPEVEEGATEDGTDALPAGSPTTTGKRRTAKVRWAEALTTAKLVAMSKRVQRKRNSLGLDPSSDVPIDVVCRAELMCHWGIHRTLLDLLDAKKLTPQQAVYLDVMDFFYYFAMSPSNARELQPYLQVFVDAIHTEDVRVQATNVLVAVLSSRVVRRSSIVSGKGSAQDTASSSSEDGMLDFRILDSISMMMAEEVDKREPDSGFLRLVNKHLLMQGNSALSQASCRQFLNLLHNRSVFIHVASPKSARSSELQLNSCLVDLLQCLCNINRSLKSLVQRILPSQAIITILLRTATTTTTSSSSSLSPLPRLHQAPYFRVLQDVYLTRDEESDAERDQVIAAWMDNSSLWAFLRVIARQYTEASNVMRRHDSRAADLDDVVTQATEFWCRAVPSALAALFTTTFKLSHLGAKRTEALDAVKEIAGALCDFASELPTCFREIKLTLDDVAAFSRVIRALDEVFANVDGVYSLSERVRHIRRYVLREVTDHVSRALRLGSGGHLQSLRGGSYTSSFSRLSRSETSSAHSGEGSFFFQANRREMSKDEIAIRRFLQRSVPKDVVLSKVLFEGNRTAQEVVGLLSNVVPEFPEHHHHHQGHHEKPSDKRTPPAGSVNRKQLFFSQKEVEAFVCKVLDHMSRLALSAESIACLLNLFHCCLTWNDSFPLINGPTGEEQGDDAEQASGQTQSESLSRAAKDALQVELTARRAVARQVQFDRLGLMRVVTGLSDLSDHCVTKSALEVGIALLEGGNVAVQNSMLDYFETHDESFFHNLRDILLSCMQRVHAYNDWLLQQINAAREMAASPHLSPEASEIDDASSTPRRSLSPSGSLLSKGLLRTRISDAGSGGGAPSTTSEGGAEPATPLSTPLDSFTATPTTGTSKGAGSTRMKMQKYPGGNAFVFIGEAFRFLQLMCEGHHLGMQNYIRVQSDNLHSINVVQEVLSLVSELCAVRLDETNGDVVVKGFALLTEFCQGPCTKNQATLLQNDVCRLICAALSLSTTGDENGGAPSSSCLGNSTPLDAASAGPNNMSFSSDVETSHGNTALIDVQVAATVTLLALIEGCSRPEVYQKILLHIPLVLIERVVLTIAHKTDSSDDVKRTTGSKREMGGGGDVKHSASLTGPPVQEDEDEEGDGCAEDAGTADGKNSDDLDDEHEELLFNLLIFAKSVSPFLERSNDRAGLDCVSRIFSHVPRIAARLGSIQLERDGVVERVFFPIPEICLSLTQHSKDEVLWSVDRTSRLTKLNDFSQKIDEVMFEMNSTHRFSTMIQNWSRFNTTISKPDVSGSSSSSLTKSYRRISGALKRFWNDSLAQYLCTSDASYYEQIALIVAVCINTLFVLTDSVDSDESTTTVVESIITLLCMLQLGLYVIVLATDCVVYLPVFFYRRYRQQLRTSGILLSAQQATREDVFRSLGSWKYAAWIALYRFTTVYYSCMVIAALAALMINPFFASLHLFGLIYKSAMLRTVIVAITQNGKSLILTMGLGVIIVYMFSVMGYMYFPEQFDQDGTQEGGGASGVGDGELDGAISAAALVTSGENCQTLGRCFMFILTNGLRQGGGVGDLMQSESWSSPNLAPRMGYDFAFYALVNVVFLNILFGIIIDTFAELRDDKRRKEEDMNTCCFICGLDAEVFEKEGGGFRRHVRTEHNMWQYLYFVFYLRQKDANEFTGQESYVHGHMLKGSLSFYPDGKCLTLMGGAARDGAAGSGSDNRGDGEGDDGGLEDGRGGAGGGGSGNSAAVSAAAISTTVGTAVKTEMESLREQMTTTVRDAVAAATSAIGQHSSMLGQAGDLVPSASAPSFGVQSTAPSAAAAARRRSRTIVMNNAAGDGSGGSSSAFPGSANANTTLFGNLALENSTASASFSGDSAAGEALLNEVAKLKRDLASERDRSSKLQLDLILVQQQLLESKNECEELQSGIKELLVAQDEAEEAGTLELEAEQMRVVTEEEDAKVLLKRLSMVMATERRHRRETLPNTDAAAHPAPHLAYNRRLSLDDAAAGARPGGGLDDTVGSVSPLSVSLNLPPPAAVPSAYVRVGSFFGNSIGSANALQSSGDEEPRRPTTIDQDTQTSPPSLYASDLHVGSKKIIMTNDAEAQVLDVEKLTVSHELYELKRKYATLAEKAESYYQDCKEYSVLLTILNPPNDFLTNAMHYERKSDNSNKCTNE